MARATFVKSAQKDIYEKGASVNYESKKGKRAGQTLNKIDRTVPNPKGDTILIAKGEPYYWWAFQYGGKHFSKIAPKPSQLTQSNYLGQLYTIQESIDEISAEGVEDLEGALDAIKSDLESLKEETEGSLENMPESLQSSPTGELLQERIDALDNAISELEGIDLDYEEPDTDEIKQEILDETDDEEEQTDEMVETMIEERKEEKLREWLDEKIDEIQGVSLE